MASWLLRSTPERASGFEPWPGTLCCVLGQDTEFEFYSHSASLHPGVCGGETCDGLASRPGEVEILQAASCYRNRDKLRQLWARLGSKASLFFILFIA